MPPVKNPAKWLPTLALSKSGHRSKVVPSSQPVTQAPVHLVDDCIVRSFESNCKKKIISIESNLWFSGSHRSRFFNQLTTLYITKEREIWSWFSKSLFFANCGYLCGQEILASFNCTKKFWKAHKNTGNLAISGVFMVETTGLEPVTSCVWTDWENFFWPFPALSVAIVSLSDTL